LTAQLWIEKAERSLITAHNNMADGDFSAAVNRSYYAIFNAARASLIHIGEDRAAMSKSHSGMIAQFSLHQVKSGRLDERYSEIFGVESTRRMVADYQGDPLTEEDAQISFRDAAHFVAGIKRLIDG
jgi:uncharacterized protein (UPF0332 family)